MAAVSSASAAPSSETASDPASFFTPTTTVGIIIAAVVLLVLSVTMALGLFVLRRRTRNAQDDLEHQDVKVDTFSVWSRFSGLFARASSRPAEPELPWPVLQILPHLRPRRQRILDALMFWRKPKHPEPFTVADVLRAKLEVEAKAEAVTVEVKRAGSAGWWRRILSCFGRSEVVFEIVVGPFDASHTVSPISSPASTASELESPMPLTPVLPSSSFPAVVSLTPVEPQAGTVHMHVALTEGTAEKLALPTEVGLGIIHAGIMSTASSAADIFHDASTFCCDLNVPHPASIRHSVSLRDLDLASPSSLVVPPVGGLTASRSTGFVIPSRSSTRFGTFVEALRSEAAARLASRDSEYFDCTLTPSRSVYFDCALTPSASVRNLELSADGSCANSLAVPRAGSLRPSRSTDFIIPSRSSKRFDTFVEGLRSEAAARLATSDSVYFDFSPSPSSLGLA